MKKTRFFLLGSMLLGLFASCSTKVDLYADYKDVPVIYGLLDVKQDTNYVKIVRAFSGTNDNPINAYEVALIPDSNNYPGKLDARICRYGKTSANYVLEDYVTLDTMTIHNKHIGTFYSPDQLVYYVVTNQSNQNTAFFKTDVANKSYKYELVVLKGIDTVSSETCLVGGENFKINTNKVTFSPPTEQIKTRTVNITPADNAAVYELKMAFYYREKKANGPLVDKQISWKYGNNQFEYKDGHYIVEYNEATLFNALADAIKGDTLNVERYFNRNTSFEFSLAAGGSELYNYIQINSPSEGISQTIPDYTNIKGGFGLFSSRINLIQNAELSAATCTNLIGMNWGFHQEN